MIKHNVYETGESTMRPETTPIAPIMDGTVGKIMSEVSESVYMDIDDLKALIGAVAIGGHVIEDAPYGTGKTMTARTLGTVIGGSWGRIQGNNDVMPSDITGSMFYNHRNDGWDFHPGPIFNNVVLFDEIQRAPEKAQDNLIESMAEGQVTPAGSNKTFELPQPHLVIATRNPDGLPIRQGVLDRFAVSIEAPQQRAVQRAKVDFVRAKKHTAVQRVTTDDILKLQDRTADVSLPVDVQSKANYFIDQVFDHPMVDREESIDGGYRGYRDLKDLARFSALSGQDGQPVDVTDLAFAAPYVLSHRVVPTEEAYDKNVTSRDIVANAVQRYLLAKQE